MIYISILENKYLKILIIIIIFLVLFLATGFSIMELIDIPSIAFLVIGTPLITILEYKKTMTKEVVLNKVKKNLIIVGIIVFFIGFYAAMTTTKSLEYLPRNIAASTVTLFDAMIFYLLLDWYKSNKLKKGNFNIVEEEVATEEGIEVYNLTEREKAVLNNLLKGMTNKEIAEELFITENTVKKHISSIYNKAGVKNRHELLCSIKNNT